MTDETDDPLPFETTGEPLASEATRYLREGAEEPERLRGNADRLATLLTAEPTESVRGGLQRRAAAGGALAILAAEAPESLADRCPTLVRALDRETRRKPFTARECRRAAWTVRARLVRAVGRVLAADPAAAPPSIRPVVTAVRPAFDDGTLRAASRGLFACADERPAAFGLGDDGERAAPADPVAETIRELLGCREPAVAAWSAAAVGRLADHAPDAVAPVAPALRRLLSRADPTVRHNALEAVAALVDDRPDAVAPAADTLRALLGDDSTAVQHNAAAVLAALAATSPSAVTAAAGRLRRLLDHHDPAVRRAAATALARLSTAPNDA